jgi:glycosyltransferase involved in cell wall biosynthesis
MTKVSIIIPCYNQACFLPECIGSLLAQTYPHWEAIIINDGSSDNTREVALKLCEKEPRLRYIEQENRGLSGARNAGLDASQGELIQFLDADDLLMPEKIQLQLSALKTCNGLAFSYCDFYYCDATDTTKEILNGLFPPPKLKMFSTLHDLALRWEDDLSIPTHCFLFDARFFTDNKIRFDESLPNHEDWDCWMKISTFDPHVIHIDSKLAVYRVHAASMSRQRKKMGKGFLSAIYKQKKQLRGNHEIVKLLNLQLVKVKKKYHIYSPITIVHHRLNLALKKVYKKTVPWPIQKTLFELFKLEKKSNTKIDSQHP